MRNLSEIEKELKFNDGLVKENEINRKIYLDSQLALIKEALQHDLSKSKKREIKKVEKLLKLARRFV